MYIWNFAKHLKWSKKEHPDKISYPGTFIPRLYNMSGRDLNTVELLNNPGF